MDNSVRTYTTRIFLNDEQAKKRLEELTAKVEDLRKKQDEAARAGDWKTFNNLKRELTQTTKEMDSMKTSAQKVERVLNDLSGASVKEIRRTITAINKELASGPSPKMGGELLRIVSAIATAFPFGEMPGMECQKREIPTFG